MASTQVRPRRANMRTRARGAGRLLRRRQRPVALNPVIPHRQPTGLQVSDRSDCYRRALPSATSVPRQLKSSTRNRSGPRVTSCPSATGSTSPAFAGVRMQARGHERNVPLARAECRGSRVSITDFGADRQGVSLRPLSVEPRRVFGERSVQVQALSPGRRRLEGEGPRDGPTGARTTSLTEGWDSGGGLGY
jgi:hypothetical protein